MHSDQFVQLKMILYNFLEVLWYKLHCCSNIRICYKVIHNLLINLCFEDFILVYTSNVQCIQFFQFLLFILQGFLNTL